MTFSIFSRFLCLSLIAGLPPAWAGSPSPAPLFEYKFNDAGTGTRDTGGREAHLTLADDRGQPADLHGTGGSGVSGKPEDRAFDNSATVGMGKEGAGGSAGAARAGLGGALDGLQSCTVSGWYKTEGVAIGAAARLVDSDAIFVAGAGRSLMLAVNRKNAPSGTGAVYGAVGEWVFFAVTYDAGTGAVEFFAGGKTVPVASLQKTAFAENPGVLDASRHLTIGNNGSRIRPFDGWIDNVRIHGSKTDGSGVLSLSALEKLRQADLK